MVKHSSVTVGTTATAVTSPVVDGDGIEPYGSPNAVTRRAVVTNTHASADVFLGGEGVTSTAFGYTLKAGASLTLELGADDHLYAVSTLGGEVLRVLHLGV